jgi:hypothetical protein
MRRFGYDVAANTAGNLVAGWSAWLITPLAVLAAGYLALPDSQLALLVTLAALSVLCLASIAGVTLAKAGMFCWSARTARRERKQLGGRKSISDKRKVVGACMMMFSLALATSAALFLMVDLRIGAEWPDIVSDVGLMFVAVASWSIALILRVEQSRSEDVDYRLLTMKSLHAKRHGRAATSTIRTSKTGTRTRLAAAASPCRRLPGHPVYSSAARRPRAIMTNGPGSEHKSAISSMTLR